MHPGLTRALRWVGLLKTGRALETRVRMRQDRSLPDAVILGAQKSGTSSLHGYLVQHGDIIAPLRKEVHYFDLNHARGECWYRAHFGRHDESGLNLDSSPYYLFHPCVPERMHALLPDARLIVLLRDPVRRAYSHYWHNRDHGRERLEFEAALAAEPERTGAAAEQLAAGVIERSRDHQLYGYLARGRYAEQLERWRVYYPPERMLVLRFEDFAREPLVGLNQTRAFLGLPPVPSARLAPRNTRNYPPLAEATRLRLRSYFEPENARLEALLGRAMEWQ